MRIWIDLDNTPHVPFFAPIIRELAREHHDVVLTARDAFQVRALADRWGLSYSLIGRHDGRGRVRKVAGLLRRSAQLLPFCREERPDIALSHGSRAQILLGNALGIPTVLITDYEHARTVPLGWPKWVIVPRALLDTALTRKIGRVKSYRGIKEDVYVPEFAPDPAISADVDVAEGDLIVVVRPPATEAHYHTAASESLFEATMSRLTHETGVRVVLLPRSEQQKDELCAAFPQWFDGGRTVVPHSAVNGLDLLWLSDLAISGGGTMSREAAALGVPAYSIFGGELGAVDQALEREGRLVVIRTPKDIHSRILLEKRERRAKPDARPRPALSDIIAAVDSIAQSECGTAETSTLGGRTSTP